MRLWTVLLALGLAAGAWSSPVYMGHSGAPGRLSCASSCHGGSNNGTVQVTGFPVAYTPGQTYTVTIDRGDGAAINNFNASCRIGTGTANAGVIGAGTGTATYNVAGETNGVHFSQHNQNAGTFTWTAPQAGTGSVILYVAAHQVPGSGGPNTEVATAAEEATGLPGAASNPNPADSATGVSLTAALSWTAGAGATHRVVYFGTENPPPIAGDQVPTSLDPTGELTPGTTYYWQVAEANSAGSTPGPIWHFTTQPEPGVAINPSPADHATGIGMYVTLTWTPGTGATTHDVYFGMANPPPLVATTTETWWFSYDSTLLLPNTVYYWQVNERNANATATGPLWSFTTNVPPDSVHDPLPPDGATDVARPVTLCWSAPGAEWFYVRWGLDSSHFSLGIENPDTSMVLSLLLADTTYYWEVTANNNMGLATSPIWRFRTQGATAAEPERPEVVTDAALGPVYPNPFNAVVTVPFALSKTSAVELALYDVTGRQVAILAEGTYGAGSHRIEWSSDGFATGVYILRLTAGKKVLTTKVAAIK